MVFGKHAPLSCESASRRKVMPAKDQHHRSRAASETPYSSEPKSRASSFYLSPSGGNGVTGAWLDKLNRHFTGNGPSPATAHASTFSLSSNSSTDERYAGGSWWGASRDESHGDDTRSVMTTDTASLSRASMASRASPDRVASPSISEPGAISRLRSPFFSKRSESKLEEKQPSMKQLPSNASLTSMFSHFTSSNNPRKGSAARPPVHVPSHRASISAASTSSSATANTTLSSIYPQMQMDENMPTRHGIPLKKKEGHLFYPVPVKSSWSRTNVDEIPSSVPDGEGDAKAAPSVHGTLEEDPRSLQKSVSASSASLTYTKPTSANPLIRLADAKRRENRLSTARRGGGGSRWKSHEVLIDEGTPQHAASATSVSLPHRRRSSGTNSVNSSLALVTVELGAVCRVCREDLVGQENTVVLQCEVCPMVIHPMCLSMTESVPCPTSFDEARIQKAFLKVFTSLMRHYRQHLATPEQLNQNGATPLTPLSDGSENSVRALDMDALQEEWFRKDQFLAACEKDARPFMTQFVDTQAFAQFTLDRVERPESDYEVLFFDESIKEKRNRSRLHLGKDSTPFLKETAYDVRSTILCLDASVDNIEAAGTRTYSTCGMPVKMDEELFGTPRHVQPLITPSDHRMMRSMTNELVQRARIATTMRRKQDFSKWMRSKWKHFQKVGGGEVVSLGFLSDEQRRYDSKD
ncbi:hypothetical protein DFS34DRAFT_111507 [Phlyctochytrium arcticum]|nr:hypothetical protein DFS34DRAFT_111507 [Phlyctochytrium arcticum]